MSDNNLISDEAFLAFIQDTITTMKAHTKIGGGKDPNFFELQSVLYSYQDVRWDLDKKVNQARLEFQYEKEDFDQWFAEEFVRVRARENRPDLAASKWVGAREIEYMVRAENARAYRIKRNALNEVEQRYEFLKDIKESWDSFRFTLSTLSNNLRSEIGLDNMGNRLTRQ